MLNISSFVTKYLSYDTGPEPPTNLNLIKIFCEYKASVHIDERYAELSLRITAFANKDNYILRYGIIADYDISETDDMLAIREELITDKLVELYFIAAELLSRTFKDIHIIFPDIRDVKPVISEYE